MYTLSGFDTAEAYEARTPTWEPDDDLRDRGSAEAAGNEWLRSRGEAAQVEVIRVNDGIGRVVAVVTQNGVEEIEEEGRSFDPIEVAAQVVERLGAQGVEIDARRVVTVMRAHAELTGHGDPEQEVDQRSAAVARVADATGEGADVIARIFDEVDRAIRS